MVLFPYDLFFSDISYVHLKKVNRNQVATFQDLVRKEKMSRLYWGMKAVRSRGCRGLDFFMGI